MASVTQNTAPAASMSGGRDPSGILCGSATTLRATDPRAVDRVDLLTVVEHELGHIAGLDDLDASIAGLMHGQLATGVRRTVGTKEIDAVLAAEDPWNQ